MSQWFIICNLLLLLIRFNFAVGDSAENCIKDTDIISGKHQDDVWTDWISFRKHGSDNYINDLVKKYPGCGEMLQDVSQEHRSLFQYRLKYVASSDEDVAEDITIAGNLQRTISFKGIVCNNEDDSCLNYEIRFRCGTNIPVPDYQWDLSGKPSFESLDYDTCSYSTNRFVYPLQGGHIGRINGDLFLMDSYPRSETKCSVFFNGSTVVEFSGFNGSCITQPGRCNHGFSVSLWIAANTSESGPILKSSGNDREQDRNTDGFHIRIDNGTLKINIQSCTKGIQVSLNDSWPSDWFHLVITFHPHNYSHIDVFINGHKMVTETRIREIPSPMIEPSLLVSGMNGSSDSSVGQKEFGLSNVKVFNHKLSVEDVARLHFDDTNSSSLEVLQIEDISNDPDLIDLQCVVKTCADNTSIHWLYYSNITTLLTSNLTTLYGRTERKSKCQVISRFQGEYKPGVYVCEPRADDSYAYKVVKVERSSVPALDSSTLEITTDSSKEAIATTQMQQPVTQEFIVTDIVFEEDLKTTSEEHNVTPNIDLPFNEENTDKNQIVTRKENNLEINEEISNFIQSIPSASREKVENELSEFDRLELELLSIEKFKLDSFEYRFEHKLLGKQHSSMEAQMRHQNEDRQLIGGIRLPFTASTFRKQAEDLTLALAYGEPNQNKEYHVNVTSSGKHIQGTMDDGILFMWVFIANKEVSVNTNFSIINKQVVHNLGEIRHCSFWDDKIRMWSTKGCQTVMNLNAVDSGRVTCVCNHTTSFAIILQVGDFQVPYWMKMVSKILGSISICCLLLVIGIFIVINPVKNYRIIIHGNLAASLGAAQLVFMTTSDATQYKSLCQIGAVVSHYLFTVFLTWMLIEGYLLYQKTVRPTKNAPRLKALIFIGWGIPSVLVASSFALKKDAYGAIYSCWLDSQILQWAFVAQASLVVLVNSSVLIIVMKKFTSLQVNVNKNELERIKSNTRALCAILPVLGLTWIFGILAIDTSSDTSIRRIVFMLLFDVCNCLQGVFILIFHCVRNREIQKEFETRKKAHRNRRSSRSLSSSNQIIRCRTTTGDLLYVPCDEKTYRNHSGSVSSNRQSTKDTLSF